MDEEDDFLKNEKKKNISRISLDSSWKKEEKKKKKEIKRETPKIVLKEKNHIIKFIHKRLGNYKFNYLQRNILFSLLAMPLEDFEFYEEINQPENIIEENIEKLIKVGLVENITTIRKKQFRGDKHLHLYWRLSKKGHEVSKLLLDWFNELEKKKVEELIK
ncbi:MAG: hypothetical protein ACTSQJ_05240 [Promethearchaeota archaeon]